MRLVSLFIVLGISTTVPVLRVVLLWVTLLRGRRVLLLLWIALLGVVLLRRGVSLLLMIRGRILLRLVVLTLMLRLDVVLLIVAVVRLVVVLRLFVVLPAGSLLVVGVAGRVWTEVALRRRGLIASAHLCV